MGYRVSRLSSISTNDDHSYFLYFLPGSEYRQRNSEMVNQYFEDSFFHIAKDLGPNGVIVTPHRDAEEYISDIAGLELNGCIFAYQDGFKRDELEEIFHNGHPYLIVTKDALSLSKKADDAIIIDLDTIPSDQHLGQLVHLLVLSIKKNDLNYFIDNFTHWDRAYDKDGLSKYLSALELRPNLFGIGVDLKKLFSFINTKLSNE